MQGELRISEKFPVIVWTWLSGAEAIAQAAQVLMPFNIVQIAQQHYVEISIDVVRSLAAWSTR